MAHITLAQAPKGSSVKIESCLAQENQNIYRLIEMGLHKGANIMILNKFDYLNALELLVKKSRICIANDLASKFLVTIL